MQYLYSISVAPPVLFIAGRNKEYYEESMEKDNYISIDTAAIDFEKFIESLPGKVYWKDKNTIVMGCNDLQVQALGLSSKTEIIGRTDYDLTWKGLPDAERSLQAKVNTEIEKEVMRSGIANTREEHITTAAGTRNYLVIKVPLKDTSNQVVGLLNLAIEITDPKKIASRKKKQLHPQDHSPQQLQMSFHDPDANTTLKILLIEDNQLASKTAKLLLENAQYEAEVEVANNSVEALTLFLPDKYDIVFADVGLPDLDGYQLATQLRKIEEKAHSAPTPIIALTAYDSRAIHQKATAAGISAILNKPLASEKIDEMLNRFVYDAKNKMPHFVENTLTKKANSPYTKRCIDLIEGAKILGQDEVAAQKMLEDLLASLPEVRKDIEKAFCADNFEGLHQIVHKFYGGLCYVGVPPLRQAGKELDAALSSQEHHQVDRLYQRLLDEMSALEKEFALLQRPH